MKRLSQIEVFNRGCCEEGCKRFGEVGKKKSEPPFQGFRGSGASVRFEWVGYINVSIVLQRRARPPMLPLRKFGRPEVFTRVFMPPRPPNDQLEGLNSTGQDRKSKSMSTGSVLFSNPEEHKDAAGQTQG